MITFGIRQSFDRIEQVEERYANLNAPVEVALPYYWDIYEPVRRHLAEIAEKIKFYGTTVLSIHAVQAPITDEKFKILWKEKRMKGNIKFSQQSSSRNLKCIL